MTDRELLLKFLEEAKSIQDYLATATVAELQQEYGEASATLLATSEISEDLITTITKHVKANPIESSEEHC